MPTGDRSAAPSSLSIDSDGTPSSPRQINMLVESKVSIAAPRSVVWPLLLDRESWVPGLVYRKTLSGSRNQPGELAFVHTIHDDAPNDRFEQVLVAAPGERFLLAMMAPDAGITVFADYRLKPTPAGCDVRYAISLTKILGDAERSDLLGEQLGPATQKKIDDDLLALKRVAERRAR